MVEEIMQSGLRILLGYLLLLIITRIIGRKMVSQITFFDFVVAIIIGSVVANLAVSTDSPVVSGVTVLASLGIFTVVLQYFILKSYRLRKIVDFESKILIENGKINAQSLKQSRMRLDNLLMLLREQNAFNIADVEFAVLETDGKLSVLKKSHKQPVTPSDLNIPTAYTGLTKDIIMDGKVIDENLAYVKLDRNWLMNKLKENNYHSFEEVFYAGLDTSGNLYISSMNRMKDKSSEN